MNQLFKAVVFEVAANKLDGVTFGAGPVGPRSRWLAKEVEELRVNSGLPADQRVITSDLLAEAVLHKLGSYLRSFEAEAQAMRLSRRFPEGVMAVTVGEKMRASRAVVRINIMSRQPFVEAKGTPVSCSPASETYWSM